MSKTLILIPSRLSASRLPGKPLLRINGISLINHVYKKALKIKNSVAYVATGDQKIFEEVKKFGGKCILTKKKHRTGSDRIYEALQKIKNIKFSYVLNLQGDEPLINIEDINKLIENIKSNKLNMGTLACKLSNILELKKKNLVKVKTKFKISKKKKSTALNFYRVCNTNKNIYHHIGIYIYKKNILKKIHHLKQTQREKKLKLEQLRALDNNISIYVCLAENKPIGIDTIEDFKRVKKIMELNN